MIVLNKITETLSETIQKSNNFEFEEKLRINNTINQLLINVSTCLTIKVEEVLTNQIVEIDSNCFRKYYAFKIINMNLYLMILVNPETNVDEENYSNNIRFATMVDNKLKVYYNNNSNIALCYYIGQSYYKNITQIVSNNRNNLLEIVLQFNKEQFKTKNPYSTLIDNFINLIYPLFKKNMKWKLNHEIVTVISFDKNNEGVLENLVLSNGVTFRFVEDFLYLAPTTTG